jgi:hypothetical protein
MSFVGGQKKTCYTLTTGWDSNSKIGATIFTRKRGGEFVVLKGRPWKDHFKSDLRSDQVHRQKNDLRSDQEDFFFEKVILILDHLKRSFQKNYVC